MSFRVCVHLAFERRKSPRHKWVLARSLNGAVPLKCDDLSSVSFDISNWKASVVDDDGVQFLAAILPDDCDAEDAELLHVAAALARQRCPQQCTSTTNIVDIAAATQAVTAQLSNIVFVSALSLDTKHIDTAGTIVRLLFRHMQLKLCSATFKHARVHCICTMQAGVDGWRKEKEEGKEEEEELDDEEDEDQADSEEDNFDTVPCVDAPALAPLCKPIVTCIPINENQVFETYPKNASLVMHGAYLAISLDKCETKSITRWLFRRLEALHCDRRWTMCCVAQNFSVLECRNIEQYVDEQRKQGINIVIGVSCEATPVSPESRCCTTLLNEFDGHTTRLIQRLVAMQNVCAVFETTKSFCNAWCCRLNIVNALNSEWFQRVNSNNTQTLSAQYSAQTAALVDLIAETSRKTADLVCAASDSVGECFFDCVVLCGGADYQEKQRVYSFLSDKATLEPARWQTRVARLQQDDALLIPLSERQNVLLRATRHVVPTATARTSLSGAAVAIPAPTSYLFTHTQECCFGDPIVLRRAGAE